MKTYFPQLFLTMTSDYEENWRRRWWWRRRCLSYFLQKNSCFRTFVGLAMTGDDEVTMTMVDDDDCRRWRRWWAPHAWGSSSCVFIEMSTSIKRGGTIRWRPPTNLNLNKEDGAPKGGFIFFWPPSLYQRVHVINDK